MKNGIVINKYGTKFHYKDDKLHREDGPAVIQSTGTVEYWFEGKLHREDGPAVIYSNGAMSYYIKGKLHREDGPAVIHPDDDIEYHIEGKFIDAYFKDFGCFKPKSREEALERLDRKERPYSREMYLADINKMWPIEEN